MFKPSTGNGSTLSGKWKFPERDKGGVCGVCYVCASVWASEFVGALRHDTGLSYVVVDLGHSWSVIWRLPVPAVICGQDTGLLREHSAEALPAESHSLELCDTHCQRCRSETRPLWFASLSPSLFPRTEQVFIDFDRQKDKRIGFKNFKQAFVPIG